MRKNDGKRERRNAPKRWLVLGLCVVSAVFMFACGGKETGKSGKTDDGKAAGEKTSGEKNAGESAKKAGKEKKLAGKAELTGTSSETLAGGIAAECTTTLKLDFDAMEAVLTIDCDMPVGDDGTTMLFTLADEKKGDDATRYMQCMEMGKGKLTDNGDGTCTANWEFTVEGASEPMEYSVTVTAGEDGIYTAEVMFDGLFAEPVKITSEKQ